MTSIEEGKLLKDFSTFGIGGPARYFVTVKTSDDLKEAFQFAEEKSLATLIIGRGSNCLFSDRGFNGLVILNRIDFVSPVENNHITVGAGYSFSLLGTQTARQGYSGLEFASGIPGTVGGAIFMNAGANGTETCDTLVEVAFMHKTGKLEKFTRDQLKFSYRSSPFHHMSGCVVSGTFHLHKNNAARLKQLEIIQKRKASQPLKEMSAGCIFRNPAMSHSGKLIEECGLKGFQIGGAKVSEIHANFIVNTGNATAEDVRKLMHHIREKVKEKCGEELLSEVRMIPCEEGE